MPTVDNSDLVINPKYYDKRINRYIYLSPQYTGTIPNLTANTVYYVRAYAINSVGTAYGEERTFITEPPALVSLNTLIANTITYNSFITGLKITEGGGLPILTYGLCWSTSPKPTIGTSSKTEHHDAIHTNNTRTKTLNNLNPDTKYYVRAYAINNLGISYGEEIQVTTLRPVLPTVTTGTVTDLIGSNFTCDGNIKNTGNVPLIKYGLCWGTTINPQITTDEKTENSSIQIGLFRETVNVLETQDVYYVRAYATNMVGTSYGEVREVRYTTPTVDTKQVSNISYEKLDCGGTIQSTGGKTITKYGLCWNTTGNPTLSNSSKTVNTSAITTGNDFSENITSLLSDTKYYICAYVETAIGVGYGTIREKTTKKFTVPKISTTAITYMTGNDCMSGGNITNTGGKTIDEYGVCWGISLNPTITSTKTVETNSITTGTYVSHLINLNKGTTYHVRAYAKNSEGVDYGQDIVFTSPDLPTVTTDEIGLFTSTTCDCGGKITDNGGATILEKGLCWNTKANPDITLLTILMMGNGSSDFSSNITGLKPFTLYYVRAYAKNITGISYGEERTFTTKALLPTITTTPCSVLSISSILCGGNITDNGGDVITEQGICYSDQEDFDPETLPTANIIKDPSSTRLNDFLISLGSLSPNTKYYVQAYATNSAGTAYGDQVNITISATSPELTTKAPTHIKGRSAKSGGDVTSNGGATMIERGICWGIEKNPVITNNPNKVSNGKDIGEYVCTLTGLEPNTPYYIRAYAINAIGTAYGKQYLFVTDARPTLTATLTAQDVHSTVAVSGSHITDDGRSPILTRGICWGTMTNPTIGKNSKTGNIDPDDLIKPIVLDTMINLVPDTRYYVRAYATNNVGISYGSEMTFVTNPLALATVTTTNITDIQDFSAMGGGDILYDGGAPVTQRGIYWSKIANFDVNTDDCTKNMNGSGLGNFESILNLLEPVTTYYVRAYAVNSQGMAFGEEKSFTTLATVPTLKSIIHTNITDVSIDVESEILKNGGASITERGFCWNDKGSPTINDNKIQDSNIGLGVITRLLSGFTSGKRYYVCAYATNAMGTGYSKELSFTTMSLATITTKAISGIERRKAYSGGNITLDGGAAITKRGVCWSTSVNPDVSLPTKTEDGTGAGNYSSLMTGLTAVSYTHLRAHET